MTTVPRPLYTARIFYEQGDPPEECVECREPIDDGDTITRWGDGRATHDSCHR